MLENVSFIKPDMPFDRENRVECIAPMFRRKFHVGRAFKEARLAVCGLGYGHYWLNDERVTQDLFTAPESDYNKTLWYHVYDVTEKLRQGENIFYVICGNGFFNEIIKTGWGFHLSEWRDHPKFALRLIIDGETRLTSDGEWRCCVKSPVTYNQLRSGEHFDSRLYDANVYHPDFDDSNWPYAAVDKNPPRGVFRECLCEPIREFEEYRTRRIIKAGENRYIFDIGQNISGYVRLRVNQAAGDEIVIHYGEQIHPDNTINNNHMENHFKETAIQTDRFICNGEEFVWSPMFVYHGFRYIELTGIKKPTPDTVSGIFVHQAVKTASEFECSNEKLNRLFELGRMATYSNLFYKPTDCPTREKQGWANDAQASAEQMLINFDTAEFFKKWMRDIADAMREDGALPGIVPTSGLHYGYTWGNGPVSEGVLYELPYRIYQYTGDDSLLKEYLEYFRRNLAFMRSKTGESGFIEYGLNDWAPPSPTNTPLALINGALHVKFLRIALLAARLSGRHDYAGEFERELHAAEQLFKDTYLNAGGGCTVDEQTAVAKVIFYDLHDGLAPLKKQLAALVEKAGFHHNCGMVGLRHLYTALDKCGLSEYAYRILTAEGYPGYFNWLDHGATTLWEYWNCEYSKNHHMYSDFMAWLIKTPVGIRPAEEFSLEHSKTISKEPSEGCSSKPAKTISKGPSEGCSSKPAEAFSEGCSSKPAEAFSEEMFKGSPGLERAVIFPAFLPDLEYCKGSRLTPKGRIRVEWKRTDGGIELKIEMPEGAEGRFGNEILCAGEHIFIIKE